MKTRNGIHYEAVESEGLFCEKMKRSYYFCYIQNSPRKKVTVESKSYDSLLKKIRKITKSDMFNPEEILLIKER